MRLAPVGHDAMSQILHILTTSDDALAQQIISAQQRQAEQTVKIADLMAAAPDYHALLQAIFAADSIEVW
jgi:hypothetical protein